MAFRLYNDKGIEFFIENEIFNTPTNSDKVTHQVIFFINPLIGKGFFKKIFINGIQVVYGTGTLAEKTLFCFDNDEESIHMFFLLKGKSTTFSDKLTFNVGYEANQHNLIYTNHISGKIQWESNDFQLCEINFNREIFERFVPEEELFANFKTSIDEGKSGTFSVHNFFIKPQMYQLIQDIIDCERKGVYKKMFLESKIIELLLLQLEQISSHENHVPSIKKKDIEKIYAVKEIIIKNLNKNISLVELAHQVGTNEFMLKKNFKQLFGTTVFSFWNDAKMEQAKSMLIKQDMNIKEISDLIGYKNQRHFASAFKRKFGISPSQLKNNTRYF